MPAASSTLYALVVGIDNYPIPQHRLNGCVNDAQAVIAYLQGEFPCEDVQLKTLFDAQATRHAVIEGFRHFASAKDGDVCLFYYTGHGSQTPGPAEFRHIDPDGMLESIVCYDSRLPGGHDLLDKELSYLIWEATRGKNLHFATIFDCCNSGENTRDVNATARQVDPATLPAGLQGFLGIEHFDSRLTEQGRQLTPPRGRHIHLAAARSNETAKEMRINGQPRGVFTFSLLSLLAQYGSVISYQELVGQLRARVAARVSQQTPQLAAEPTDLQLPFLGQSSATRADYYAVNFEQTRQEWWVGAGQIHGLLPGLAASTVFEVLDEKGQSQTATPSTIDIDRAWLGALPGLDPTLSYRALLAKQPAPKLQIALLPDDDQEGLAHVLQAVRDNPPLYFELSPDASRADYHLRALEGSYRLTLPGDPRPVFRRVKGYSAENAKIFLGDVGAVAQWRHVQGINNPRTTITDQQFELEWYRISQPGAWKTDDEAPAELLDWRQTQVFSYDYDAHQPEEERWLQPAFRLRIRNTSTETRYFSAVYLSAKYQITNAFMANQQLGPGEEAWMWDRPSTGNEYKSIPLEVDDAFLAYGITEVDEQLKIFISTLEIDTNSFNQQALEMDRPGLRVGRDPAKYPPRHDWRVVDLNLRISRPSREAQLADGRTADLAGALQIQLPVGVSALSALNSTAEATRSLGDGAGVTPPGWTTHQFGEGMANKPAATVLEFYQMQGAELINADNPARLQLTQAPAAGEILIPVALDPETGLYYPVGMMLEDGSIELDTLPDPTPTGTRSLGGSIKIFFQKKIGKYLPGVYAHPQLAVATLEEVPVEQGAAGLKVVYQPDSAAVTAAVAGANRIALFIHGIIGDTTEMPKALRLATNPDGQPLEANYDLMLTFDYENLDTPIKETGRLLKEKLAAVGLGAGHGKTLHIIAHSMGGLVSRWFIEKEDGNQVVSHLYMFGTPNEGSPYGSLYEMATPLLATAVNGAAFMQPYLLPLRYVGKFVDKMFTTLKQMQPASDFLKELNDHTDPGIPYTIVAGNTRLIPVKLPDQQLKLMQKIMARFKQRGHYDALDLLLFKAPNDIAVAVDSIGGIPGGPDRQIPTRMLPVACDHLTYFATPAGLAEMAEALRI